MGKPATWHYHGAVPETRDGIRPDAAELWIRFVLGAIFGAGAGFAAILDVDDITPKELLAVMALSALAAGLLARQFGDRFWEEWLRRL